MTDTQNHMELESSVQEAIGTLRTAPEGSAEYDAAATRLAAYLEQEAREHPEQLAASLKILKDFLA